ncbi:Triosephosphate isomerase [Serratia fonticola]|uniref:Triosephosphate isomerase n=1 Tax=Serratia fonticola TaxID=47917 RepID=A0A4U9TFL0_SERFO|nr:Triosephosphate isomerase [Serratia fonticola]
MRHPLVMGNWKLNGSVHMVNELIAALRKETEQRWTVVALPSHLQSCIWIWPSTSWVGSRIALGAQNVDINLSGAFTGEVSATMLKDVGAEYIIIGHSERRTYHKETDAAIAEKFAVLKAAGLIPVLCIGETEAENEAGKTEEVCARQIDAVLKTQALKRSKAPSSLMSQYGLSVPVNPPPQRKLRQCTNLSVTISPSKTLLSLPK